MGPRMAHRQEHRGAREQRVIIMGRSSVPGPMGHCCHAEMSSQMGGPMQMQHQHRNHMKMMSQGDAMDPSLAMGMQKRFEDPSAMLQQQVMEQQMMQGQQQQHHMMMMDRGGPGLDPRLAVGMEEDLDDHHAMMQHGIMQDQQRQ
jgi:hypothetical protein